MVDKTLSDLLSGAPVTTALTGDEPLETVVSGVSKGAKVKQLSFAPLNPQTGTSYTLDVEDQGRVVTMSNASANAVTIPLDATEPFPIGASLLVRQIGAGVTSIAVTGGVTLQIKASLTQDIAEQYGQIVLHKVATNTWHTTGEYLAL